MSLILPINRTFEDIVNGLNTLLSLRLEETSALHIEPYDSNGLTNTEIRKKLDEILEIHSLTPTRDTTTKRKNTTFAHYDSWLKNSRLRLIITQQAYGVSKWYFGNSLASDRGTLTVEQDVFEKRRVERLSLKPGAILIHRASPIGTNAPALHQVARNGTTMQHTASCYAPKTSNMAPQRALS
mgnify:CR=1 FL=1